MKPYLKVPLIIAMFAGTLAACGGGGSSGSSSTPAASGASGSAASGEKKVIKVLQLKREIIDPLKKMGEDFTKEHPNIELEFMVAGDDYDTALKAAFASGNEPDVFMSNGDAHAVLWQDKYLDLSGEPWMANMAEGSKPSITIDGNIYGMAVNIEGFGFIYNKDLFTKAGITETPKTLSELEEVAKKLKEAGITPFVNFHQEPWMTGKHGLNAFYARQADPEQWVKDVIAGAAKFEGDPVGIGYLNLIDLMIEYGQPNSLTTDVNTAQAEFAAGNAAIIQQGNWIQPVLDKMTPDMKLGMFPMPISDDAEQNKDLFAFAGNYWVINKNSKVIDEAKILLDWMVNSETGQKYIVEVFKFVPAFKNIEFSVEQLGPLAGDLSEFSNQGLTKGRYYNMMPPGSDAEFGAVFQRYIAKQMSQEDTLKKLDEALSKLTNK
ncbi:ABC transporter substrate-binding protein [Cohnella hongkongensis]|uniref:ABC transporter substrate-binding protein n=1 Tax=Cohnella hongkongensis TaxID=178337 RepID=A0ABV9F8R0_9BACL